MLFLHIISARYFACHFRTLFSHVICRHHLRTLFSHGVFARYVRMLVRILLSVRYFPRLVAHATFCKPCFTRFSHATLFSQTLSPSSSSNLRPILIMRAAALAEGLYNKQAHTQVNKELAYLQAHVSEGVSWHVRGMWSDYHSRVRADATACNT